MNVVCGLTLFQVRVHVVVRDKRYLPSLTFTLYPESEFPTQHHHWLLFSGLSTCPGDPLSVPPGYKDH